MADNGQISWALDYTQRTSIKNKCYWKGWTIKRSGVYPPRSSGTIPPIRITHAFLPPPSFRHAFYLFLSLSSSSLYPCPFPFLAPSPVESGHVDTTPENLANLDVRTCILMWHCLCWKTVIGHYAKMDLLSLFLLWTYLKHLIQWIVMLFWILLMDRQLPRNFIALLQNWLDICYACVCWGGSLSYWYLVLCYSWCELGRRVIASFVCNLIYLYGCFCLVYILAAWCLLVPYYC